MTWRHGKDEEGMCGSVARVPSHKRKVKEQGTTQEEWPREQEAAGSQDAEQNWLFSITILAASLPF